MIRANIEAAIEAKRKEISKNFEDIKKIDAVINNLKNQKYRLLDKDSDLYYELEELEEQLNVSDNN